MERPSNTQNMITAFRPHPGSHNEEYLALTLPLPANPATQAGTQRHFVPVPMGRLSQVPNVFFWKDAALAINGSVVPDHTGTMTARVVKRSAGGTVTPLSATVTIADAQAQFSTFRFSATTATDVELTINETDQIGVEITHAGGTITTQPSSVVFVCRLGVVRS